MIPSSCRGTRLTLDYDIDVQTNTITRVVMMYVFVVLPLATANIHHSLPDLVELIFCLDG